jgi:hypothetical protein
VESPETEVALWALRPWPSPREVTDWFEQTAWWSTSTLARAPHRALVELLDALAGRFTGRELTLEARAHALRLRVNAVRIRARELPNAVDDPLGWWAETTGVREFVRWSRRVIGFDDADDAPPIDAVTFDATDVHIDGLLVGNVAAHIDGVRLDPGVPTPELVSGPIDLDVHTTRARVVDWLRRELPAWDIQARSGGLLALRPPRRRSRVLVDATLHGRGVRIETVGVVVFGREVRLPRMLTRSRVYALPSLDPSLEIVDVSTNGNDVMLRVRHEGIRQPVRLDALRAAIRDGAMNFDDAIFSRA